MKKVIPSINQNFEMVYLKERLRWYEKDERMREDERRIFVGILTGLFVLSTIIMLCVILGNLGPLIVFNSQKALGIIVSVIGPGILTGTLSLILAKYYIKLSKKEPSITNV